MAALISGCVGTGSYPELYDPIPLKAKGERPTREPGLTSMRNEIRWVMSEYARDYRAAARATDLSTLPLIGAAAAAASALAFGAHPDLLAGIGIGAGTYAVGRSVLQPDSLANLYIEGYSAARCIDGHLDPFLDATSGSRMTALDTGISAVTAALNRARAAAASYRASPEASTDVGKAHLQLLDAAISNGQKALAAAQGEKNAAARAAETSERALADVQVRVASKARTGRPVELSQIQAAMGAVATAIAGAEAPASTPDIQTSSIVETPNATSGGRADAVMAAANLATAAEALNARLPGFQKTIEEMAKCPAKVT